MNRSTILPAASTLVLSLAGALSAQPLPYGSYNAAGRVLDFGEVRTAAQAEDRGSCSSDLCLTVTLAPADAGNPSLCGTATSLDVTIGEEINVCYTLTNHSSTTLNYHTLVDSDVGTLLSNHQQAVPPHSSFQYNRVIVASTNQNATSGDFTSTWTAFDAELGYTASTASPPPFVDISASGTALNIGDDGAVMATAPFPLRLYGAESSSLCVGNNGGIAFGVTSCSTFPYANRVLPATNLTGASLLPYWDDLMASGMVYHGAVGTAPNRQYIVAWHDKTNYGNNGLPDGQHGATFEVVFNESSDTVLFAYRTASFGGVAASFDNGASATVGLQQSATLASQFSYNTASLSDGMTITWTPVVPVILTATADATVAVGAPRLSLTPSSGLTPSVNAGSTTRSSLQIANVGNRDLAWSWQPPSARAHFPAAPRTAIEDFARSPAGQALVAPEQAGRGAALPRGVDSVPAYGIRNGNASTIAFVSFDLLDATHYDLIRSGHVFGFAADFVNEDFTKQYAVTGFDGNPRLYTIDTQTGEPTLIAPVPIPVTASSNNPYGAAWDPFTNQMFVTGYTSSTRSTQLYTVDIATGQASPLGAPLSERMIGELAIDANGLLYGMDVYNDVLVAIDKTTGEAQAIGPTGLALWLAQGLDFDDRTGTLYLAAFDQDVGNIYTIDTMTGQATLVGPSYGEIGGLSIATTAGACATEADTPWLHFVDTAGTIAPGANGTTEIEFDAAALAPGSYEARLCFYSNDPDQRRLVLPVQLTVTDGDVLFRDGFEGAP
ncbi:MAG: hypothetical protein DI564_03800 [Rhodanobacter denitrificans]|uniref:Uncharacterized protein n=1 Tax=Rhodanobacter denitrificans TaxID=666685 RepID=A0A2W5MEU3_9GAMM|nr:MAG: hypothetical protein DI564_03800 [Rhodanobacter denitrificans]